MEKLEQYRIYVQQVLTEYAQIWSPKSEIDRQLIFDPKGDHYQLVYVGWKNRWRQYGLSILISKMRKSGFNMMGLKLAWRMNW